MSLTIRPDQRIRHTEDILQLLSRSTTMASLSI